MIETDGGQQKKKTYDFVSSSGTRGLPVTRKPETTLRTWRHRSRGLVTRLDRVGGGTADGDVGDGRRGRAVDVAGWCSRGGVQHDHGRRTGAAQHRATRDAAPGRAHRSRTAVASRVPARALGLLAARALLRRTVSVDGCSPGRSRRWPSSHLVYVLVVVLAGRRAPRLAAAPVGRRRRRRGAQVLVRPGAGAAVAAVHLHLDCGGQDGISRASSTRRPDNAATSRRRTAPRETQQPFVAPNGRDGTISYLYDSLYDMVVVVVVVVDEWKTRVICDYF